MTLPMATRAREKTISKRSGTKNVLLFISLYANLMLGIILTAILLPRNPQAKNICDEIVDRPFGLQRNKCDQLVIKYEQAQQARLEAAKISTTLYVENSMFAEEYFDEWMKVKLKIRKKQSENYEEWQKIKSKLLNQPDPKVGGVGWE